MKVTVIFFVSSPRPQAASMDTPPRAVRRSGQDSTF